MAKTAKLKANDRNVIRSRTLSLNGKELLTGEQDALPELNSVCAYGKVEAAPGGCSLPAV